MLGSSGFTPAFERCSWGRNRRGGFSLLITASRQTRIKTKKTAKNTPSMMGKGRDYCGSNSVLEICKDFLWSCGLKAVVSTLKLSELNLTQLIHPNKSYETQDAAGLNLKSVFKPATMCLRRKTLYFLYSSLTGSLRSEFCSKFWNYSAHNLGNEGM